MITRYGGSSLGRDPRIAVVTNDALGNFVAATPMLQMLRERHGPCTLDYYGGTRVTQLAQASDLVDTPVALHGMSPRALVDQLKAPYDLVVNVERGAWAQCATAILAGTSGYVCGPCIDNEGRAEMPFLGDARGDLWRDENWVDPKLTQRYDFLDTGFIGEILCRLAYLDGPVPGYRLARESLTENMAVPDVILSITASLPDKLWPIERWKALVDHLTTGGLSVGLVGAKPVDQGRYWQGADDESALIATGVIDLRGLFSLPQVVSVLDAARLVLSLDNGIVHLGCATNTPVVGLFRNGIHRLWAPPQPNLHVIEPGDDGRVADIDAQQVRATVDLLLR